MASLRLSRTPSSTRTPRRQPQGRFANSPWLRTCYQLSDELATAAGIDAPLDGPEPAEPTAEEEARLSAAIAVCSQSIRDRAPQRERRSCRLTPASVAEVRRLLTTGHYSQAQIAQLTGVNTRTIGKIAQGRTPRLTIAADLRRCPGCGGLTRGDMPCALCASRQKKARP